MNEKRLLMFRLFLLVTALYAGFIFYLSSLSDVGLPLDLKDLPFLEIAMGFVEEFNLYFLLDIADYGYENFDKIEHMFLYFGFGAVLYLTFHFSNRKFMQDNAIILSIVIGLIYGALDELHQMFVPGRVASSGDLLANAIGIILAQFLLWLLIIKIDGKWVEID